MPYLTNLKPGQEVEVQGWITQPNWSPNATFSESKMAEHGYIAICPHTLRFKVPDYFNATVAEVEAIETALEQKAEEYHRTTAALRARKNELLQLAAPAATEVVDANPGQQFKDLPSGDNDTPF